jgi:multidrug efflux system membrane fusion protein
MNEGSGSDFAAAFHLWSEVAEDQSSFFKHFAAMSTRWWIVLLSVAALLGSIIAPRWTQGQAKRPVQADDGARRVPVAAVAVRTGDMAVYLSGLGTVTPLETVTVKSRVDGQLIRVAFREGQLVRRGDLLAEIDPRPFEVQLAQAEGMAAKDQATLQNAKRDLERYQVLVEQDSAPRQQLDTQRSTVDQLEASIKADQAQIDAAKLNLTYSRITAPLGGRVGLRLVDPGNIVHAADQTGLLVLTQVDPIGVVFTIPEDSLSQVLRPMRSGRALQVDAYDRDANAKLATGSLLTTDNQIDQTTGTIKLKAVFSNRDGSLFPNQFVNARVLVDTVRGAVIVPSAAVQHGPQATFVFVVKADSSVDMRHVDVRLVDGETTAIARGLSPGDRVVTDGLDKLQQGTKVSIRSPGQQGDSEPQP